MEEEELIDGILNFKNEVGEFQQYSLNKLSRMVLDERHATEIAIRELSNHVKDIGKKNKMVVDSIEYSQSMFPPEEDIYP